MPTGIYFNLILIYTGNLNIFLYRVRQMTLRNRVRNEKLLTEQTKELAAAATCVSTARSEKKSSNSSSIKTRASSANPPPSTSNSKESNKKRKPKVYKDIFNDEEIKNQNNFVSSSPISNRMLSKLKRVSLIYYLESKS